MKKRLFFTMAFLAITALLITGLSYSRGWDSGGGSSSVADEAISFVSDDLVIDNTDPDGLIILKGRDNADTSTNTLAEFDPDAESSLYWGGDIRIRTRQNGLTLHGYDTGFVDWYPTVNGYINFRNHDDFRLYIDNEYAFKYTEGGAAELYYAGAKTVETITDGIRIFDYLEPTRFTDIVQNTDVLEIKNTQTNGQTRLTVEDSNGTERIMVLARANGTNGIVSLYAGGGVNVFQTTDDGGSGGLKLTRGGSAGAEMLTNSSTGILTLTNNHDGAAITIAGNNAGGTARDMIVADPDTGAEFYIDGSKDFEVQPGGISIYSNGGASGSFSITSSATEMLWAGSTWGGHFKVLSKASGTGASTTLLEGDPDGAFDLYYAGTKTLSTLATGIEVGDGTYVANLAYDSDDFVITNKSHGGNLDFRAEDSGGVERVGAYFNPGGGWVVNHAAGASSFRTITGGVQVEDGTGTRGKLLANGGQVIIDSVEHGDTILLRAENSSGTQTDLLLANPDGAAELYYAGTKTISTSNRGLVIGSGAAYQSLLYNDTVNLIARNDVEAGSFIAQVNKTGTGLVNSIIARADAGVELMYSGTKTFETKVNGAIIGEAGGANQGLEIAHATANASIGYSGSNLIIRGHGALSLQTSDGGTKNVLYAGSGAESRLYYDNTETFRTLATGIEAGNGTQVVDITHDGTDAKIDSGATTPSDLVVDTGSGKTLKLAEPVYMDYNIGSANFSQAAANVPDYVNFLDEGGGDTGVRTYAFAVGEELHSVLEVPHNYVEGTDFVFHVDYQAIAAPTGTDNVQWQLEYTFARAGETLDAMTTITSGDDAVDTQYGSVTAVFPAISGSTGGPNGGSIQIQDQFIFILSRVAAVGDAFTGDALLQSAGVHYQVDTLGSRTASAK